MQKPYYLLVLLTALPLLTRAAESYTVDTEHSYVRFSVSHFLILTTHGRFEKISGKVMLDRLAQNGSIDVDIEAGSINTDYAKRDENLRGPNFFNAAKYPAVSYHSSAIQFINDTPASVEGKLTMLGVTRPVTLAINTLNCDARQADKKGRCSATASAQIKRSDFGMTYYIPLIGDEIKLALEIETYENQPFKP